MAGSDQLPQSFLRCGSYGRELRDLLATVGHDDHFPSFCPGDVVAQVRFEFPDANCSHFPILRDYIITEPSILVFGACLNHEVALAASSSRVPCASGAPTGITA